MDFNQITDITEAQFSAEQAELRNLILRETEIRRSLSQLENARRADRTNVSQNDFSQRSMGGDVLWQSWISRTRQQKQIELAQTLVQKAKMIDHIRRMFGRDEAAKSMRDADGKLRQSARVKRSQINDRHLSILIGSWDQEK